MSPDRPAEPVLVLLRAVNVGGRNVVPMAALASALDAAGFADVRTYIQSGNVVLTTPLATSAVATRVRQVVAERFGLDVDVMARDGQAVARVLAANPFPDAAATPKALHVAFLDREVDAAAAARLDAVGVHPDRFVVDGDHVYLHYAAGQGRSRLSGDVLERRLGARATARNWSTVTTLAAMVNAGS